jgi:hypothetical protein
MRFAKHALIIGSLLALAAMAGPRVARWQQSRLADRMALEVLAGDAGKCGPAIDQLAGLGLPAVEPLMFLAACGTPQIAAAAQDAVLDLATTWEIDFQSRGDAATYANELAELAAALELHAGRFDAAGWPWQQRLARRTIANCEHVPAGSSLAILRSCDRALATSRPAALSKAAELAPQTPAPLALPEDVQSPPLIAAEPIADHALSSPAEPKASLEMPTAKPLNALRPPADTAVVPPPTTPWDEVATQPVAPAVEVPPALTPPAPLDAPAVVDVPSPGESEALLRSLRRQSDRELLARLAGASRFESAVVEQALRRRGYSQSILDAISHLRNTSVEQRRHALERIDALPAADARRVLRWFADDPEPTLRLKALAMIAASGDPRLAEIARQRATQDADPRVAALANRLMRQAK